MKDIQPALRAFLLADAAVSAAVGGGRIYSITFPQGTTEPSVLMTRISGLGEFHLQGPSGLNRNRVQLGSWAQTVADACELARLVKVRLNGYAGTMGTGQIAVDVRSALYDSEREIYDEVTTLYGVTHDYLIMFDELTA